MFGRLDTTNLPVIVDHADAVKTWDGAIKTRDYPERKWLVHNHRDKWIVKHSNGDIGVVYGGTEVICYNVDETITITPYSGTQSFTDLANRVLPAGFSVDWKRAGGPWISYGGGYPNVTRYWRSPKTMTCAKGKDRLWRPTEIAEPFEVVKLDRKKLNAALKSRGADGFEDWARALVALGGWRRVERMGDAAFTTCMAHMSETNGPGRRHILAALAMRDRWIEILSSPALTDYTHDAEVALRKAITAVRMTIITMDKCIKVTKRPYLDGSKEFNAWASAQRKYKSAIREIMDAKA